MNRHEPVDDLEPEQDKRTAYLEASYKFLHAINPMLSHIGDAMRRVGTPKEILTAYWQVAFALGSKVCGDRSMTQIGDEIGVERATISKGARQLCVFTGLPPSLAMKREEAAKNYQAARVKSIICHKKLKPA